MAPTRKLKTYNPSSSINSSIDAVNFLFAKNMTQRLISKKKIRKKKLIIQQLPQRREETILTHDSLHVSTEDTFDKLRKGPTFNPVKIVRNNISTTKMLTLSDSSSKFILDVSDISPRITRSFKNMKKSLNKSDSIFQHFRDPTIEVLSSIQIETNTKDSSKSLSYIKIPTINQNNSTNRSMSHVDDVSKMEESFSSIFSKTMLDKKLISCSTPVVSSQKKIISPIKSIVPLLKKSFEDIKKWGHEFPKEDSNKSIKIVQNNEHFEQMSEDSDFINLRKRRVIRLDNSSVCSKNSLKVSSNKSTSFESTKSESTISCNSALFSSNSTDDFPGISKKINDLDNKNKTQENCLVVSLTKPANLEDFEKFYSHYISQTDPSIYELSSDDCIPITNQTPQKNVVINLSNNFHIFETFYQHHYAKMTGNSSEYSNKKDCPLISKNLIVNITKSEDIFEKFYNKTYCELEQETSRRRETETEIKNIITELIVNVTQNNFQDYIPEVSAYSESNSKNKNNWSKKSAKISNDSSESCNTILDLSFVSACNKYNITSKNRNPEISTGKSTKDLEVCNKSLQKRKSQFFGDTSKPGSSVNFNYNTDSGEDNLFDITLEHNYSKGSLNLENECYCTSKKNFDCRNESINHEKEHHTLIIDGSFDDSLYRNLRNSSKDKKFCLENMQINSISLQKFSTKNNVNVALSNQESVIDLTDSMDEPISSQNDYPDVSRKGSPDIIESSVLESSEVGDNFKVPKQLNKTTLKPGKLWRRSLLMYRRSNILPKEDNCISKTGEYYFTMASFYYYSIWRT